jgi:hypothetical protein
MKALLSLCMAVVPGSPAGGGNCAKVLLAIKIKSKRRYFFIFFVSAVFYHKAQKINYAKEYLEFA